MIHCMIPSISRLPAIAVLGLVLMPNFAWCQRQQSFDLINDLDLLVPAAAKSMDSMLEADIDENRSDDELDRIEATFAAAERSKNTLGRYKHYFEDVRERELRLMHAVVDLKRSEFDSIDAPLKKKVRLLYLEIVQTILNLQVARQVGWSQMVAEENTVGAAIRQLQDELLRLSSGKLDAKRAARYHEEIKARRDFAKEAMVESIVTSLALNFAFSNSQREQVEHLVRESWQDSWQVSAQSLLNDGVGGLRDFPKDEFKKLLRESQKVFFDSIAWKPTDRSDFMVRSQVVSRKSGLWNLANELEFAPEVEEQP